MNNIHCIPVGSFGLDDSSELEAEVPGDFALSLQLASVLMIPASLRRAERSPGTWITFRFGLDDSSELEAGRQRRHLQRHLGASVLMIPASLRRV